MSSTPFTISLSSEIQINPSEKGCTFSRVSDAGGISPALKVPALPGFEKAIAHLQAGTATLQQLTQTLSEREGTEAGEQLAATLQQMGDRGWLQYAVLPLAIAEPMVESAELDLNSPHWTQAKVSLSRFAYQRNHAGGMVLESPLSKFRVKLLDWRSSAILAQLTQPQPLGWVTPPPQIGAETAYQFLNLLWATGFLTVETEAPELKLWEFHNLLFHSRCRQGRHDYPTGDIAASLDIWDEFPVVKPPMSGQIVPLPQLSIDAIRQRDKTLTTAIEKRQSIREYDENHPITVEQLGELLYRTARIKEIYTRDAEQAELLKAQFGDDFDWGEISRRPYPCGSAMYELEIYLAVRRCAGVKPGLYHYDPLNHQLAQIDAADADIQALIKDAHQSTGEQGMPQVLLIITARFGRLFRKYRSLAYALVLKHVGILYQNLYLVGTNLGLASCAVGGGDSDRFAQATGLDYVVESSVGEFMLGSLPSGDVQPSKTPSTSTTIETEVVLRDTPEVIASDRAMQSIGGVQNTPMITPSLALERPSLEYSENIPTILSELGASLLISSYEGELTIIATDGEIRNIPFSQDHVLGMAVDGRNLALSTRDRIWQLQNIFEGDSTSRLSDRDDFDAYYQPISVHKTGDLFTHEMAWIDQKLWFINTAYSCLCTLEANHDFIVQWHPQFISELVPEDRCHLNGLGVKNNKIQYVTAVSETDTPQGWRDIKDSSGILIDIESHEILLRGLAMPHSPRWYDGRVWLLEAMKGTLVSFDIETKEFKTIAKLPGFARGLDILGNIAFVGTSCYRHDYMKVDESDQCGVWAINLKTGQVIGKVIFNTGINELSSVHLLPGIHSPKVLGWPEESLQSETHTKIQTITKPFSDNANLIVPSVSSPAPAASTAQHPHDLDDRIPGLAELRNQTLGDPRITIVILDGNPDHTLSCFEGAEISKVFPYWHPPAEPVPNEAYRQFQAIGNDDTLDKNQKAEAQQAAFPEPLLKRIHGDNHACHITSTIVGQENTPSPGLAPGCRVINVPLNTTGTDEEFISPLSLARAFELGLNLGANIIHCAACRPTQTGEGEELLLQALKKCQDNNILIVAPAGNNKGECWCMPASLPGVLSVGALKPDGTPYKFSNWGGNNALEGIMAPGGEILGAQPANEEPVRLQGTSMAAPVMTGLCSLLMSLQLQQGKPVDAEAVRAALLNTAIPCTPDDTDEPERCLRGKVNLPGAMGLLFGSAVTVSFAGEQVTRTEHSGVIPAAWVAPLAASPEANATGDIGIETAAVSVPVSIQPTDLTASTVKPSQAHSGNVYVLGTIGYDFGDAARRDTFKQNMAPVDLNGVMVPPDPYDARQMVEHLDNNPEEAHSLIWTLNLDQNTIYVLDPKGPFANDIYEMFLVMLNGQLEPETSAEFIERVSVPGRQTDRTVELFSEEVVPVLTVHLPRGMYGWNVNALVDVALATVDTVEAVGVENLREGLTAFLNRVYYDLHNIGQTSRDRALNFAVTNTFQAAATFAEAIASDRKLDTIEVEKSPYCRLNSDCWDVLLTFFDPEDGRRSRQVFRFTIDVADSMPVTVGSIKRWAKPGKKA